MMITTDKIPQHTMISGHRTVVTESPFTAREIGRRLDVPTFSTYGHLFDYDIISKQVALVAKNPKAIDRLSILNARGQHIIIATDNDAQGELIASHIKALTPKALHTRVSVTALCLQTLEQTLAHPMEFNDRLAAEGAYLRVLNRKLRAAHQKQFLTTTSIALSKSFRERGRTNHWINHTLEIGSERLQLKLPRDLTSIDPIRVQKPQPCTTRMLTSFAAMANIEKLHEKLQALYESTCISYFRTDSSVLPSYNHCYRHHVSSTQLTDSHYAIHNLVPPTTDLEAFIYNINESAVTGEHLAVSVETKIGHLVAANTILPDEPMTPQSEVMLHLAVDKDSYASTIAKSAPKYANYLYNGNQLNDSLIDTILKRANDAIPELVEYGTKEVIRQFVEHDRLHTQAETQSMRSHDFSRSTTIKLSNTLDIAHSIGI